LGLVRVGAVLLEEAADTAPAECSGEVFFVSLPENA